MIADHKVLRKAKRIKYCCCCCWHRTQEREVSIAWRLFHFTSRIFRSQISQRCQIVFVVGGVTLKMRSVPVGDNLSTFPRSRCWSLWSRCDAIRKCGETFLLARHAFRTTSRYHGTPYQTSPSKQAYTTLLSHNSPLHIFIYSLYIISVLSCSWRRLSRHPWSDIILSNTPLSPRIPRYKVL